MPGAGAGAGGGATRSHTILPRAGAGPGATKNQLAPHPWLETSDWRRKLAVIRGGMGELKTSFSEMEKHGGAQPCLFCTAFGVLKKLVWLCRVTELFR